MSEEELEARRNAEVEFVSAAYEENEAWVNYDLCQSDEGAPYSKPTINRRLSFAMRDDDSKASVILTLRMPIDYPEISPLEVSAVLDEERSKCSPSLLKAVYDAIPELIKGIRQVTLETVGEESVFTVLGFADDWLDNTWPTLCVEKEERPKSTSESVKKLEPKVLGRRLIYSHHIISKIKRANMKELGAHYRLTGYVKIGWPGLIIIEGLEENCIAFYDDIRPWAWQYLVVRGEQQELVSPSENFESKRRFSSFQEVSDMSLVAKHCQEVGLEALFRTSMKQYDNTSDANHNHDIENSLGPPYGALVHVDHMNDGKGYRKWLRRTGQQTDVFVVIKQCFPNHDFTKRPLIIVGIVGDQGGVSDFLKRWRTTRVDVDGKGKACLERKMKIIAEGELADATSRVSLDMGEANGDENVNIDQGRLRNLILEIGGEGWAEALRIVM